MLTALLPLGIGLAALVAGISGAWSPCGFAMIETFTPHMCGGRARRNLGVALFAVGAILASAALGAVLGFAGSGVPRAWSWALVGVLALVGAARDLGIIRVALPQRRGQVPEPWRRTWPLVAWAPAYGVMLGLGVLTFQVVSTFWVVSGAAIAVGNPAVSAACFALFGLGRVLMVIVPPPFAVSHSAAAAAIAPAVGAVRRINGAVLAGVGVLALAASPVLGATALADTGSSCNGPTSSGSYWPSISGSARAWTIGDAGGSPSVEVTQPGTAPMSFACAWAPSVYGNQVAYVTNGGIALVSRTTQARVLLLSGNLIRPSYSGAGLAYVRVSNSGQTLFVRNLATGTTTEVTHVPPGTDISGPSVSGAYVAWAADSGRGATVFWRNLNVIGGRATHIVAQAVPNTDLISPSVYGSHIAWIIERGTVQYTSKILYAPLSGAHPRTIWSVSGTTGAGQILWGTSMTASSIATTVWHYGTDRGSVAIRRL